MNHLDLYLDDTTNKEIVIVGGGAVGLDVAEYFANRGASPTIIEMMNQIGRDLDPVTNKRNDGKTSCKTNDTNKIKRIT